MARFGSKSKATDEPQIVDPAWRLIVEGIHTDPHQVLGAHVIGDDAYIRAFRPNAQGCAVILANGAVLDMDLVQDGGVWEAHVPANILYAEEAYRIRAQYGDDVSSESEDPYRFWPTIGELDLYLFGQGKHEHLWQVLGANAKEHQGANGVAFGVWAPNAKAVHVVGDFNVWNGTQHPMRLLGESGVWELFIPGVQPGARYKFEIIESSGKVMQRADPFAFATEPPPQTGSVIMSSSHTWTDAKWMEARGKADLLHSPFSVYEVHLGSWRRGGDDGEKFLTYRELAEQLPEYVTQMGFTHVEFLPVAEHPFGGSWGYQVSSYFAPTARFGTVDDFKVLVEALHNAGIGVIVDWVPAHFPKDEWALAKFDGTALFEHADPRKGEQPDWGTLVFNFARHEVRNFLMANALFWLEEFHIDGLRVDAVASMLYLDYSRKEGEWVPNEFGGRENLEAVSFIKELNELVYRVQPGATMIAEESTAWPGVSRPTYLGGLGFGFKWNMGWMHDTLEYFSTEPIYRRYHHNDLTFGFIYAWSENFMLPISHDEVVHGKGSLFGKMPGDKWQKHANLRALYGWMWAHPGKQLLFMGCEIAQTTEWSHDRSIDWHLLEYPEHRGTQELVTQLNRVYKEHPAMWELDENPEGFRWIDASDVDQNVLSFLRVSKNGQNHLVCVANLSPVPRYGYRIGLPHGGPWREVLNTDATEFGGSGTGNLGWANVLEEPWHGLPAVAEVTLPPLGVVWFAP